MIRALATLAAVLLSACVATPAGPSASASATPFASATITAAFDGTRAKAHVDYLADPGRGGRYTGSPGYNEAASYVAERFREIGLEPLGDNRTYFQHFTMPIVDLTAMPELRSLGPSGKRYQPRVEFTESVGGRAGDGAAEAAIAVVGGAARSSGQNDFAGADVKGKIALITGPALPGGGNTIDNAFSEGAVGALVIGGAQIRYSYIPRFALPTIPTLVITETVANELLAPSGKTVRDIQAAVRGRRSDPGAPESGFDVATTVRMSVSLTPIHDVDAINVVGLLRAAKPETADRAVLVGGHLDGVGTDPDGSVFPAANDNASGTALTIEVARALTASRAALVHSVIFVAFAGEEQGFIGSESYITKSAVTPGRVESLIAMIDLDVIGCCGETLIVSNESPELQKRVRDAAARLGVPSQSSGGGGSDQVSFARRRVPAVFVGWSDAVLHTYRDAPGLVQVSTLVKAGEVITQVTSELATND